MKISPPVVGIVADYRVLDRHPFHCVGNKYVQAVAQGSKVVPVLLPALASRTDFDTILGFVDGLLFTGSPSNVAPRHYGEGLPDHLVETMDEQRDATSLPLIRLAIERGVPMLGLCRGFQEINVALGGSLHQEVHKLDGFLDHREDDSLELEQQYGPSHPVDFTTGGLLARITGLHSADVNSLHGQGLARVAPGVTVEARAPDGLVEAFTVDAARSFALALQWHPEWRFEVNPVSQVIFQAFGEACQQFHSDRSNDHKRGHSQELQRETTMESSR